MSDINLQTQMNPLPQILGRIKLSNFLAFSEEKFGEFTREIENAPLFKKFTYPDTRKLKIISFKRYPQTSANKRFCEFNEDIAVASSPPDVQKALAENPEIIDKIKSIGMDNFKEYFLYCETDLGLKEIANACGITFEDAVKVQDFVNSIEIMKEFNKEPNKKESPSGYSVFNKIAKVVMEPKAKTPRLEFFSLNYSRGKYVINYKRLAELKTQNLLSNKELKELNKLLRKLELINARKTVLYQMLVKIVNTQTRYFKTGEIKDLRPYTQNMVARVLGVNPGTISRVINNKTLETSRGEEKQLKFFLPNGKQVRKELIKDIFLKEKGKSDRLLAEEIKRRYGFNLARRTVCQYKKELNHAAK